MTVAPPIAWGGELPPVLTAPLITVLLPVPLLGQPESIASKQDTPIKLISFSDSGYLLCVLNLIYFCKVYLCLPLSQTYLKDMLCIKLIWLTDRMELALFFTQNDSIATL